MRLDYTATVRLLRIAIPAAGGLLLLLLVLWPYITHIALPHMDKAEIHGDRLVMINPNYHSTDDATNPYTVAAARATQYRDKPDLVTLEEVKGQLTTANQQTFQLQAQSGVYDRKLRTLQLTGQVILTTADGSSYVTDHMHVDLVTKSITGNSAVTGIGNGRTLHGVGFDYAQASGLLVIRGPATLVLDGNKSTNDNSANMRDQVKTP